MTDSIPSSKSRIWAILERTGDLLVLLRLDGTVTYVSDSIRALLGIDPAEAVVMREMKGVPPEDQAVCAKAFAEVCAQPGARVHYEFRVNHRDGTTLWLECVATNQLHDPEIASIVTLYRDITARKGAEAELRETQRRMTFLLSATSAVTYSASPTGEHGATFISENVLAMTGHTPQQYLADPTFWVSHLHPEDRQAVLSGIPVLFELGYKEFDYRFLHADGNYRWVHDACSLVRNPDGSPKELIGYWVDVTARRAAQEAVRSSEETFRTLIENHPAAMLVHRDGKIVRANPAMLRLLGYASAEELFLKAPLELVHPEDLAFVQARMAKSRVTGRAPAAEQRLVRKDGSALVAEVESVILNIDGRQSAVVFARDLTERRELLARMAAADRMVAVGMLASGVAHEINNPLAYLITNLSLLEQGMPALLRGERDGRNRLRADDVPQLLADAQEAAGRVAGVVRDLRTLSHAEPGELRPTDVRAALGAALKMAQNLIRHRARLLEQYEDVPPINAVEGQLVQVFLNVLVNAAQAIPEGRAEQHRIQLKVRLDPDRKVAVEIHDTGVGIPAEALSRIFDPFFTTKRAGEGTGLGLAICQRLVRAFDGDIRVSSEPGQGTRVVLRFPPAPGRTIDAAQGAEQPSATPGGRVLIVDDEPRFGTSLRLLLTSEYQVRAMTDAREALAVLQAGERYDAILCDLMMPCMTGMEFHGELSRRLPDLARRVIFLTGGAMTAQARDFLAQTSNPCLDKPVTPQVLKSAIDAVIG